MSNKPQPSALGKYLKGAPSEQATPAPEPVRRRGQGETVSLTVRLSHSQWERVHQLAIAEGVSIQHLAVVGLSMIFKEKGLPELTP
jgi:hypothetical protein